MSVFRLVPAQVVPPATLLAAFNAAFADYLIGPFALGPAQWPGFLARQAVALPFSRVALLGDEVVAFALVAPRGARWRLACMGALPAARGSGAAPALLDELLARATAHGLAAVELEVFAQNERALRLYRDRGFVEEMPLHGYTLPSEVPLPPASLTPQDVDREVALAWLMAAEAGGLSLPLQVCAPVLGVSPLPWRAWQSDSAQLVFMPQDDAIDILSLVDTRPAQQAARALLLALRAAYPSLPWRVPQLQAPHVGGEALLALGASREPLYQYRMQRPLA